MKIIPALLHDSIENFDLQLNTLKPHFNRFSIDVQDGKFVPTKTVDTKELVKYFSTHSFPNDTIFDFDLMTYEYEEALKDIQIMFRNITIGNIFIHKTLVKDSFLPQINSVPIGFALNPLDTVKDLSYYNNINELRCVQLMTIYAGPQGQPFIPEVLNKIDQLKAINYRNDIFIDGAVNDISIPLIIERNYEPIYLCVGSYLSKAGDELGKRINYLKSVEK